MRGCRRSNAWTDTSRRAAVLTATKSTARLYVVQREIVPLDSLPPHVPAAFVAIEDQRFWQHGGIDWRRAVGALVANVRSLGVRQGFSTITMQLARNAFPDRLPYRERTLGRKLAEMRVALAIEERYTKREILELYLNHIYFGRGAWGIEAAAREYFRKPASALSLAEAAMLAGMVTAPNQLDPQRNPVLAYRRRWVVLHQMWRQGVITEEEANAADDAPLVTAEATADAGDLAPYFVEEVRNYREREIGDALYSEGYTIHTTLDANVQSVAEAELKRLLAESRPGTWPWKHPVYDDNASGRPDGMPYLQGAVRSSTPRRATSRHGRRPGLRHRVNRAAGMAPAGQHLRRSSTPQRSWPATRRRTSSTDT